MSVIKSQTVANVNLEQQKLQKTNTNHLGKSKSLGMYKL